MPEKLKPCPFCGHNAELKNTGFETCRNRANGDVMTYWFVRCPYCGTKRGTYLSEYKLNSDETLGLMNPEKNGRKKAIEDWNRRADNAKV